MNELVKGVVGGTISGIISDILPKMVIQTECSHLTTMCTVVNPNMICTFEANFDFTRFINGRPDRHHARFMIGISR